MAFRSSARNIISELGSSKQLGGLLADRLACKSVIVVTDAGVRDAGLLEAGLSSMRAAGIKVTVFDEVVADTPEDVVTQAAAVASANGADSVVGFGGGSSMDVAKLVAFLNGENPKQQGLADIYGANKCEGKRLPLVQVPTTAGTGSEMTPTSFVTNAAFEKQGIASTLLIPDWAVLDGDLTVSMPSDMTATSGISAMAHAIEAYTSKLKSNPLSDTLAKEALRTLGANIERACHDGSDREARQNMLLGAAYSGEARLGLST